LAFPRLREVILCNVHSERRSSHGFRLSKYLQPTLHSLKLIDRTHHYVGKKINWLTVSFLEEVARRCPDLQEVTIWVPNTSVESRDLARFFASIRPRALSLDLGWSQTRPMLTFEVLSALSHGKCFGSLIQADPM
jgi:hypothetical protein